MTKTSMLLKIEEDRLVAALQEARSKLDSSEAEMVVDFSSVRRVDPTSLQAMEEFARTAEEKSVKVVLSGVRIDVYKVLKLLKLTRQFSFVN